MCWTRLQHVLIGGNCSQTEDENLSLGLLAQFSIQDYSQIFGRADEAVSFSRISDF